MSVIDEVLAANEIYSHTHELRRLTPRPERKLAVLTCMDTRLSIRTMGLKTGDAHIIRNAGGIVTDDSLRSLLVSHYLLETQEFMVINHTDCGLMHATEQELRTRIQNRAGTAAVAVLDARAQLLLGGVHQAAVGVVDDHEFLGFQQVVGDKQRAQGVVGDDASRVANDVRVPGLQSHRAN